MKNLFFLVFFGFCFLVQAQEEQSFLEKNFNWSKVLKKYRLNLKPRKNLKNEVAFCYRDQDGNGLQSVNYTKPLRIASLSKLFTSMWALSAKKSDYQYQTHVHIDKEKQILYLWGFDPLFSVEHVFQIIKNLNTLGITHLKKIVISNNLTIVKKNDEFAREYQITNVEDDLNKGKRYSLFRRAFKTAHRYHRYEKKHYLKFSPADTSTFKNLALSVKEIIHEQNEFFEEFESHYILKSKKLAEYLKVMNTESYNKLADLIFDEMGGKEAFDEYFLDLFGDKAKDTKLYTGSGLNIDINKVRHDNESTCESVLFILDQLSSLLDGHLVDILAFSGNNEGTLKKRFKKVTGYNKKTKKRFIIYDHSHLKPLVAAKTGSLYQKPTSAMAGVFGQKNGVMQNFAIITEYRPVYWRDKKTKELRVAFPKVKRFEEEILDSMRKELDLEAIKPSEAPIHSSLQEITETLSNIDK